MTARTRYFHGGARGLKRGDQLLPPSITGARGLFDGVPQHLAAQAAEVYRPDRVYLTTHRGAAALYASLHPDGARTYGGSLYEVEPEGDIEPDADWYGEDGGSICVPSARITRVLDRKVARALAYQHLGELL